MGKTFRQTTRRIDGVRRKVKVKRVGDREIVRIVGYKNYTDRTR